ncbi:MAG: leucine-rich repeat protein [Paludibacteraceae bacterium]|nr:leucine-rich repeat protein [Paludibacteraceae bacterium]
MKRVGLLLLCLITVINFTFSSPVKVGYYYYNLDLINKTAEVTNIRDGMPEQPGYSDLAGNFVIPETITYDQNTYVVTSIGNYAFYSSKNMQGLVIPQTVKHIAKFAVSNCANLTSLTLGEGILNIDDDAFSNCDKVGVITIPNSVKRIGNRAFNSCSAAIKLVLGDSLETIGEWAFSTCPLEGELVIPKNVVTIGKNAFRGCATLDSLMLLGGVNIQDGAFYGCSNLGGNLILPNSLTSIGDFAFFQCGSLKGNLIIPDEVSVIGDSAFYQCKKLNSLQIGSSVEYLGNYAFYGCKSLKERLLIPDKVANVGNFTFSGCDSISSVLIGNACKNIGMSAFSGCRLTSIEMGTNITNIEAYAFGYDSNYKRILDTVKCNALIPPTLRADAFYMSGMLINRVIVPCSALTDYKIANTWSTFSSFMKGGFDYKFTAQSQNEIWGNVIIERIPSCGISAGIRAKPTKGYKFVKWSDGSINNPYYITVTQDSNLVAFFAKDTFSIVAQPANMTLGFVEGTNDYAYLDTANLTVTVTADFYHFTKWSDGNLDNPRKVIVTQDSIFVAEFAVDTFNIHVTTNNSLMGTVVGSGNYVYDTNVQIEALPTIGHKFVKWSDGNLDNPRNIIVTGDSVFSAEFSVDTFAVVLTVNDSLMGSVIGSGNYAYNTNAQIEAIPNSGYEFVKWNDNNVNNPRILTVVDDITIQAEFQESQTAIDYNRIIDGVYVRDKAIIIETTEIKNSISVYNSIGQCIYVSPKSGSNFKITVPQLGMYIVRVDAEVMKVVVK